MSLGIESKVPETGGWDSPFDSEFELSQETVHTVFGNDGRSYGVSVSKEKRLEGMTVFVSSISRLMTSNVKNPSVSLVDLESRP